MIGSSIVVLRALRLKKSEPQGREGGEREKKISDFGLRDVELKKRCPPHPKANRKGRKKRINRIKKVGWREVRKKGFRGKKILYFGMLNFGVIDQLYELPLEAVFLY